MGADELTGRAERLRADRSPYVHARVVLAEAPTSAKPGAEALILADGTIDGFVGGTCAESTVRAQGMALLDSGESLLLRITPKPEADQPGKLVVHNPCLSGGTLEIFLEPVLPAPRIVIVGESPIANAVATVATGLGWEPTQAGRAELTTGRMTGVDVAGATALVVASHGRDEEPALTAALQADVPYVGLVASRRRGAAVIESLGLCSSHTSRVHCPAGLDIGARTPEEVALSIMAEIVSLRPQPSGRPLRGADAATGASAPTVDTPATPTATDPVCGMSVVPVDASLHLDRGGDRFWFCGSGCLRAFAADPDAYATS